MLSKSKSTGHSGFTTSGTSAMNKKKKPAPPRPPQPSANRMQTSQSFSTTSDLKSRVGQRSMSIAAGKTDNGDLIDFNTPMDGPITRIQLKSQEPPDFKYRVGASVFFVKSPLANSVSNNSSTRNENPFSPPRPSAQAMSRNNNNSYTTSSSQHYTTTNKNITTSKPTIIKPQQSEDYSQAWNANQFKTSTATTTAQVTNFSTTTTTIHPYTNVPLEWDEPPKKFTAPAPPMSAAPTVPLSKPTVIKPKPVPPPKKPGLLTKQVGVPVFPVTANAPLPSAFQSGGQGDQAKPSQSRPYYDFPPEFDDFDDDDDDDDDDFISKPMPNEPPPPPPPNYEVEGWIDNTNRASTAESEIYSEPYAKSAVTDRAYAIALYDYTPEAEGDLALQAGDLIYLSRKIDDSWLCGTCGGLEGMFPANYVNVVVPLPEDDMYSVPVDDGSSNQTVPLEEQFVRLYAHIDYDFAAETESDLNLQAGEVVTILGRINEDWLYGEFEGARGQFPAAFVSPVPIDLPTLKF